jgi:Tn3 transposase DDE domain
MFAFVRVVELEATSADRSVLDAVEHALAHLHLTRDYIPDQREGVLVDLSFASEQWQRIVCDRDHPGCLDRRHFEACVFTYLAAELRTGDIAVRGSQAHANWAAQQLAWEECEQLLGEFCAEAGLPTTAEAFTDALRAKLSGQAATVDAGYPENTDLVIDQLTGVPSLKRRRANDSDPGALALEEELKERMPERTLLEILARTAYWLEWWRRFGPAAGSDPKLTDPLLRYVLTTFTYGANLGPAQAARHIRGVSAHELGATAARHFTIEKLNLAGADAVNAYLQLDLVKAWGDGTTVAADGTQVDTLIDNLLAESHIRYGGYGGIAYHHIADNYIALFSHFIPCGVWEAVYIIEGLLRNLSDAEPDTIHADTQGQSYPVHALAHLFGFDLLPRIRNWKDLTFYRPAADARYAHIDTLFGEPGENTINWQLIQTHWADLDAMSCSRSAKAACPRLSSCAGSERSRARTTSTRRFASSGASPHDHAAALHLRARPARGDHRRDQQGRGLQRLLRLAALRARRDRAQRPCRAREDHQVQLAAGQLRDLPHRARHDRRPAPARRRRTGHHPPPRWHLSPYITERIKRFGEYATDGLTIPPAAFNPRFELAARAGERTEPAQTASARRAA